MDDKFRDKFNDIINRKLNRSSEKLDNEIMTETLPLILETIRETFKQDIREELVNREGLLIKKLEEHALFQAGKLTMENEYLKEEKEILLKELDKYKNLPNELKEKETQIKYLEKLLEEEKKSREIIENKTREISVELELQKKLHQQKEEVELKERKKRWWEFFFTWYRSG